MIPRASITGWRRHAPWPDDAQVEQDLLLSRAVVEIFQHPLVAEQAAFRGGTALHKLFFDPPGRYSEDIDLVQLAAGPIGSLINSIREVLDPWLGVPRWKQGSGRFTLYYRFETTALPVTRRRLKVEINTREHFAVLGVRRRPFRVVNPWFSGQAQLTTYAFDELLGTKLRALYQRKKGRDLFDLWMALRDERVDLEAVLRCLAEYMKFSSTRYSRALFEANLTAKLADRIFIEDTPPLLHPNLNYDLDEAAALVQTKLLSALPGRPWRGADERAGRPPE